MRKEQDERREQERRRREEERRRQEEEERKKREEERSIESARRRRRNKKRQTSEREREKRETERGGFFRQTVRPAVTLVFLSALLPGSVLAGCVPSVTAQDQVSESAGALHTGTAAAPTPQLSSAQLNSLPLLSSPLCSLLSSRLHQPNTSTLSHTATAAVSPSNSSLAHLFPTPHPPPLI